MASSISALRASSTATSSPRICTLNPVSLDSASAVRSNPPALRISLVKSMIWVSMSCCILLNASDDFLLLDLAFAVFLTGLSGFSGLSSFLDLGHGRLLRRVLVDGKLYRHADQVADHPVEDQPAGRAEKEQPGQENRHQPGCHHPLHLHRRISGGGLRLQHR